MNAEHLPWAAMVSALVAIVSAAFSAGASYQMVQALRQRIEALEEGVKVQMDELTRDLAERRGALERRIKELELVRCIDRNEWETGNERMQRRVDGMMSKENHNEICGLKLGPIYQSLERIEQYVKHLVEKES